MPLPTAVSYLQSQSHLTPPHLLSIKRPEPALQLIRVQASVERVVRQLVLPASIEIGRGRVFPSAERRVRLILGFALRPASKAQQTKT